MRSPWLGLGLGLGLRPGLGVRVGVRVRVRARVRVSHGALGLPRREDEAGVGEPRQARRRSEAVVLACLGLGLGLRVRAVLLWARSMVLTRLQALVRVPEAADALGHVVLQHPAAIVRQDDEDSAAAAGHRADVDVQPRRFRVPAIVDHVTPGAHRTLVRLPEVAEEGGRDSEPRERTRHVLHRRARHAALRAARLLPPLAPARAGTKLELGDTEQKAAETSKFQVEEVEGGRESW